MTKLLALLISVGLASPAAAQYGGATRTYGAPNLAASQVSVGTTATQVAPARQTRPRVTLSIGAANNCAVGPSNVTLATGFRLQAVAGATVTIETAAAVSMVCDAATTVSVLEPF